VSDETLNGRLCRIVGELVCSGVSLEQAKREFERQFVIAALRSNDGNLSRSARCIGVHRNTLHNKVVSLGIEAEDYQVRPARRGARR
jgi:DNA-binding NtrC family response regulator